MPEEHEAAEDQQVIAVQTPIQRVLMMNDLASAATSTELEKMIRSLKSGDVVYAIFQEAINARLASLMNAEADPQTTKDAGNLRDSLARANQAANNIASQMHWLSQNDLLLKVLSTMNNQLQARAPAPEPQYQPPPPQQYQHPPSMQQEYTQRTAPQQPPQGYAPPRPAPNTYGP